LGWVLAVGLYRFLFAEGKRSVFLHFHFRSKNIDILSISGRKLSTSRGMAWIPRWLPPMRISRILFFYGADDENTHTISSLDES